VEDKQIEMMKKLIEEKKKKGLKQSYNTKADTSIIENTKVKKLKKKGGLFDK
jgi:predicted DNA-binding WGR domain protein